MMLCAGTCLANGVGVDRQNNCGEECGEKALALQVPSVAVKVIAQAKTGVEAPGIHLSTGGKETVYQKTSSSGVT